MEEGYMASLQEILQSAQGGKAAENLAERFGITSEQANAAIQALAPALSIGLQRAIQNPGTIGTIIGQLTGAQHQASYQSPDSAHSDAGIAGGSTILGQIFGDANITGQIAQQASRITGLRPDLLARMLPVLATMVAGGLASSFKSQGFSNILSQLGAGSAGSGSTPAASGGLGSMLSSMLGGLFGAITGAKGAAGSPNTPSGLDGLIKMLQPGSQSDPQHQAAVTDILNRRV
jgi:hypothetical protein